MQLSCALSQLVTPSADGQVERGVLSAIWRPFKDTLATARRLDSVMLESRLIVFADGQAQWKSVLSDFWGPFDETVAAALGVSVSEVIDRLDELLEPMLFSSPRVTDTQLGPFTWRKNIALEKHSVLVAIHGFLCVIATQPHILSVAGRSPEPGMCKSSACQMRTGRHTPLQASADGAADGSSSSSSSANGSAADGADAAGGGAAAAASERRKCPTCGKRLGLKLRCDVV